MSNIKINVRKENGLRRFYYGECEELHADRGRPRYALTNLW